MTVTDTRTIPMTPVAPDEEGRAAALKMMRADAIEYVTALFDWLDEGQAPDATPPGAGMASIRACFDATEKHFHEVLAGIMKSATESDFNYQYFCTEEIGCKCLNCRYPAEAEEDERSPWTILMANVREGEAVRRELQAARETR